MAAKGTAAAVESSAVGSKAASEARRRHWSWWFVVGVVCVVVRQPSVLYPKIEGTHPQGAHTQFWGLSVCCN